TELHPNGYTISQVIQLALQHNPKMKGAEAALEQSRNQRVMAGAYLNPPITGSIGRGSIRDPRTGLSIAERTITVEQPLEWLGKRAGRPHAAGARGRGARVGLAPTQ